MITTRLSSLCLRTSSINVSINSFISTSPLVAARRWKEKSEPKFTFEFSNPVREMVGIKMTVNAPPPEKGVTYDNRLMKVTVKEGCGYTWCGCGMARTEQPFCDLTCQNIYMKRIIKGGPVSYVATETKDVWFCNCKQTDHRPFCDGTHRNEEIQNMRGDSNRYKVWEPRVKKRTNKMS